MRYQYIPETYVGTGKQRNTIMKSYVEICNHISNCAQLAPTGWNCFNKRLQPPSPGSPGHPVCGDGGSFTTRKGGRFEPGNRARM